MIEICKTCGRRKAGPFTRWPGQQAWRLCADREHVGSISVTEAQAKALVEAAKAYHASREIEDRAGAMNDWLAVLAGDEFRPRAEQTEMAI